MKKIIAVLLVLLMAVSCATVLSSCDKKSKDKDEKKTEKTPTPELDIEAAWENLEDAGYEVHYEDDEHYLPDGCYEYLYVYNYESDDFLSICYFDDEDDASDYYDGEKDQLEYEIEGYKEYINDLKEDLEDKDLDDDEKEELEDTLKWYEVRLEIYQSYVVGVKDNCVWVGTKQAIKDSKG